MTVVNTKSNKTIKYYKEYRIYSRNPFVNARKLKVPETIPSISLAVNKETYVDKCKGALYAWMVGLKSSVNSSLAQKINLTQSLYNILTSLGSNPNSFERFKNNLTSLLNQYKELDETEKNSKNIYDSNLEKEFGPRFSFLKSRFIQLLKKWDCWDYVNAKLCTKWNCSFLPDVNRLVSSSDFLTLRNELERRTQISVSSYQSKVDASNLSKIALSDSFVSVADSPLITIALKCIVENGWTCGYLMANRLDTYKKLMGPVVSYLKQGIDEETWTNSEERGYVNKLYAFLYDPGQNFSLRFKNKELEAIAAFLIRGHSYSDLISYLKVNKFEDYTLPLVMWGALCGYMEMSQDYLISVLSIPIYDKVYKTLFGVSASILSSKIEEPLAKEQLSVVIPVAPVQKQTPMISFDEETYLFLLKALRFKNPESFIEKIKDLNSHNDSNVKQSLDTVLATKDYKKAKVQCALAVGAYDLLQLRSDHAGLTQKMTKLKQTQKVQKQVLEHFGFVIAKNHYKKKKAPKKDYSNSLFSQPGLASDANPPTTTTLSSGIMKKSVPTVSPSTKSMISDSLSWLPVCSALISDTKVRNKFLEDMEWFIDNHKKYYIDKKGQQKQGCYFGKDLSNDKVFVRLNCYLNNKLNVNHSWPELAEMYKNVPIGQIMDYLQNKYGKR